MFSNMNPRNFAGVFYMKNVHFEFEGYLSNKQKIFALTRTSLPYTVSVTDYM